MNPTEPKPQPEYNCPPVCPKCQRCHRGECEPKPQTPLTDAFANEMYRSGIDSHHDGQMAINHARSLELKLQEAEAKLEVESALEKCIICNKLWSPSLVESSHCIFCIANNYKSQVTLMTGEIELAYSRLKEAERQRDAQSAEHRATIDEIVEKWSAGTKSAHCIKSAIQEALALSQRPVVQVGETPITLREAEAERIEWVRRGERAEALNEEFKEKLAEAERQRDVATAELELWRDGNIIRQEDKAERDQLIKVVDDLGEGLRKTILWGECCSMRLGESRESINWTYLNDGRNAYNLYSLLPHVQAKKGIKI